MGLVELDYFDESKDGNLSVQLEPDVSTCLLYTSPSPRDS